MGRSSLEGHSRSSGEDGGSTAERGMSGVSLCERCEAVNRKRSEVSQMYQIYAMLALMMMTWGAAMWASNTD